MISTTEGTKRTPGAGEKLNERKHGHARTADHKHKSEEGGSSRERRVGASAISKQVPDKNGNDEEPDDAISIDERTITRNTEMKGHQHKTDTPRTPGRQPLVQNTTECQPRFDEQNADGDQEADQRSQNAKKQRKLATIKRVVVRKFLKPKHGVGVHISAEEKNISHVTPTNQAELTVVDIGDDSGIAKVSKIEQ